MIRHIIFLVSLFILAACSSQQVALNVGGEEVLGGSFILCKSQVKWDGININVEGIDVSPTQATTTKSFKVAKFGWTPNEIHKIDSMAMLINGWFVDKCNSAIFLSHSPELPSFLKETSAQTVQMMKLLTELEAINHSSNDPKATVEKQQAATDAALSEVSPVTTKQSDPPQ